MLVEFTDTVEYSQECIWYGSKVFMTNSTIDLSLWLSWRKWELGIQLLSPWQECQVQDAGDNRNSKIWKHKGKAFKKQFRPTQYTKYTKLTTREYCVQGKHNKILS